MNSQKPLFPSLPAHTLMAKLLAGCLLLSSFCTQATAPRINPEMFGEEKHAEIVAYQFAPMDAAAKKESEMATEIITEAFKAADAVPTLDVLPSKQLAVYALINNDAVGFVGSLSDLAANPKTKYHATAFAFRGNEPISLLLNSNKRGDELHQAFNHGLQKIIKSGKYLELLEKYLGKSQVTPDYITRLTRQNPIWK